MFQTHNTSSIDSFPLEGNWTVPVCVCVHMCLMFPVSLASLSSYVALFPYTPRKEDELELRKGEMFLVLERCQDGWFKGTSMHTGKIGVFPGNYMSPVSRSDADITHTHTHTL